MTTDEIRAALAEFEAELTKTRLERDEYKRIAVRLAELVDRQRDMSWADRHYLEKVDQFAAEIPIG